MRVVFQSIQPRTNYHLLVSESAESGVYRYDGIWFIEPKMGLCGTGFTVYRVPVYNPIVYYCCTNNILKHKDNILHICNDIAMCLRWFSVKKLFFSSRNQGVPPRVPRWPAYIWLVKQLLRDRVMSVRTMNFQWKKRFCEMALWACAVARVPGKLCQFA